MRGTTAERPGNASGDAPGKLINEWSTQAQARIERHSRLQNLTSFNCQRDCCRHRNRWTVAMVVGQLSAHVHGWPALTKIAGPSARLEAVRTKSQKPYHSMLLRFFFHCCSVHGHGHAWIPVGHGISPSNPRSFHIGFLAIVELPTPRPSSPRPHHFMAARDVGNLVRCAKIAMSRMNRSSECRRTAHKEKKCEG